MGYLAFAVFAAFVFYFSPNEFKIEAAIADCVSQSEQTVLLRQLAMSEKGKETLAECLDGSFGAMGWAQSRKVSQQDYCTALYVNANTPVRSCMDGRGYTFLDADNGYPNTCDFSQFRREGCYQPKWQTMIDSALRFVKK